MTTTVDSATSLAGRLILARLLVSKGKPPSPSKVFGDLNGFYENPPDREWWDGQIDELRQAGFLREKPPLALTHEGRAEALVFLGAESLPPKSNWGTLKAKFLVPIALEIDAKAKDTRDRIAKPDGLAAHMIRKRLGIATGKTLPQVCEALVCKELGFPDVTRLADLKRVVLSRVIGSEQTLSKEQIEKQLPRRVVGTKSNQAGAMRDAVIRDWLANSDATDGVLHPPPGPEPAVEMTPEEFAASVTAAARTCPTGWFGDSKVLINHVWRQVAGFGRFADLDLPDFKRRLLAANKARLLELERADLPQSLDPADVRESEASTPVSTYHFIRVERSRP